MCALRLVQCEFEVYVFLLDEYMGSSTPCCDDVISKDAAGLETSLMNVLLYRQQTKTPTNPPHPTLDYHLLSLYRDSLVLLLKLVAVEPAPAAASAQHAAQSTLTTRRMEMPSPQQT